jgi:acyl-CoA:acyl-CoA alkyltransferase
MRFKNVCLESIAVALPDEVWTSAQIEERCGPLYERLRLPFGRLELMTGIRERRMWPVRDAAVGRERRRRPRRPRPVLAAPGRRSGSSSTRRCRGTCSSRPPRLRPPQDRPGESAQIFDLSNACLGFLNAIAIAAGLIESARSAAPLIAAGENGRPLVEETVQDAARPARQTATPSSRTSPT